MKQTTTSTRKRISRATLPFLSAKVAGSDNRLTGFLHLRNPAQQIEIGDVSTKEFKLVQCLFSPENFLTARHNSVSQTHERFLIALQDASGSKTWQAVKASVKNLEEHTVGKFLTFIMTGEMIQMRVG